MLLHLDDVYWTTEGRLSIDACLAAVAFLGLAILATFPLPTDTAGDRFGRIVGDGIIALVGCFVVVTLLKGKLKLGLFGIVFAPLALGGALRLAKPTRSGRDGCIQRTAGRASGPRPASPLARRGGRTVGTTCTT